MITYNWSDYCSQMTLTTTPTIPKVSEAVVQQKLRLDWSARGGRLWRNNVGADGRIRYGLANESKQLNSKLKSSDLIGITPIQITPPMLGRWVGVFTSIEVKHAGWRYRGTERERAQLAWLELIFDLGGIAGFYSGEPLV